MRIKSTIWFLFLVLLNSNLFAQMNKFSYSREIKGISETWHTINLPDDMFGKINSDYSDIRIFGIEKKDTIEAPYLLKISSAKQVGEFFNFNLINTSRTENGYFFTFEVPSEQPINEIQLNFKNENFNWFVNVEGSQDNSEWFSILEDYRIVSIKNEDTDYQFTKLKFPDSKFKFLRVQIKSNKQPELIAAETKFSSFIAPQFNTYSIKSFSKEEDKKRKQSVLQIELSKPLSISSLEFNIKDSIDYYRSISIKYLADSTKTEKGWIENYVNLDTSVLSSIENNDVTLPSITTNKLKVIIENLDNQPLEIKNVVVKGYKHQLIARFTNKANYFLTYGNIDSKAPKYDLVRFENNIPKSPSILSLGTELSIEKNLEPQTKPLFENELWLWLILGVVILLIGGFTIQMMMKK